MFENVEESSSSSRPQNFDCLLPLKSFYSKFSSLLLDAEHLGLCESKEVVTVFLAVELRTTNQATFNGCLVREAEKRSPNVVFACTEMLFGLTTNIQEPFRNL